MYVSYKNCSTANTCVTYTIVIESISTNKGVTDAEQQSAGESASNEDNVDSSEAFSICTPKAFLDAKAVHIRFLELVIQLKENLKELGTQSLLQACQQLSVNANDHKAVPLFPSSFIDTLDSPEAILNRLSSTWRWNSYTSLRFILEACKCEEGLKLLDEFELQVDVSQSFELFPLPHPSIKMAPSSTSSYTVLSVRIDLCQTQLVSLQYIVEMSDTLTEKFGVSSHALQLLAAKADPLVLYWMIPRSVIPFISSGLHEHLDYLKDKGIAEVAMYPNTILYSNGDLNVGSFALLSKKVCT